MEFSQLNCQNCLNLKKKVKTTKILEYSVTVHMIFIPYLLIAKMQRIRQL